MTQEEKKLLLIDLYARIPYGVKVQYYEMETFLVDGDIEYVHNDYVKIKNKDKEVYIMAVKPYLRPMSSMTEEELKMVCFMNALTDMELRDRINFPNMFVKSYTIETFDLFNSHHLDYRGLIEKGLALEALEDIYKN